MLHFLQESGKQWKPSCKNEFSALVAANMTCMFIYVYAAQHHITVTKPIKSGVVWAVPILIDCPNDSQTGVYSLEWSTTEVCYAISQKSLLEAFNIWVEQYSSLFLFVVFVHWVMTSHGLYFMQQRLKGKLWQSWRSRWTTSNAAITKKQTPKQSMDSYLEEETLVFWLVLNSIDVVFSIDFVYFRNNMLPFPTFFNVFTPWL